MRELRFFRKITAFCTAVVIAVSAVPFSSAENLSNKTPISLFGDTVKSVFRTSGDIQNDNVVATPVATTLPTETPQTTPSLKPTSVPTATPTVTQTTKPTANGGKISLLSDETDLSTQLSTGNVTISDNGSYIIKDVTANYGVTVKTGVECTLTIENVSLSTTNASAILVESGAKLTLNLMDENTLVASGTGYSAIAVYANNVASDYGTITIEGNGSLTTTGGSQGTGIGTNKKNIASSTGINGKIIINSGTITATGGVQGAGIGTPYPGTNVGTIVGSSIEINGGHITATGGKYAAGIGGGRNSYVESITINGGYVKAETTPLNSTNETSAKGIGSGGYIKPDGSDGVLIINGGSVNAGCKSVPKDKNDNELEMLTFTMPADANAKNKRVDFDNSHAYTDENGKLYMYLPKSTENFSLKYNNKVYHADIITGQYSYTLEEYSGNSCICTDTNSSISINMPNSISVNTLEKQTSERLAITFNYADGCTFPSHNPTTQYSIKIDGQTPSDSEAKIEGNNLIVYYAAVGKTITVTANSAMNGYNYTASKDITIIGDNTSKFDLAQGNIEITSNTDNDEMLTVKQNNVVYSVLKDQQILIWQSSKSTISKTISIKGYSAKIKLQNINVKTIIDSPITIGENITPTIELDGENKFETTNASVVKAIQATSGLVIEGDGSLTSKSGNGIAIGNLKKLTINSGTIEARGGNGFAGIGLTSNVEINGGTIHAYGSPDATNANYGGSGIGGGKDGDGIPVTINGGRVYAYGAGNAAGIGGGSSNAGSGGNRVGGGGDVVINGGFVYAKSGGSGCGIGYGSNTSKPGTLVINGGSVDALPLSVSPKNSSKENLYRIEVSLKEFSSQADLSYSIGDDPATKIPAGTNEDGKMYLYMTTGSKWLRVYNGAQTYYAYKRVTTSAKNIICTNTPEAKLNSFKISGQIGESIINEAERTVEVTVPHNIFLDEFIPETEYDGSDIDVTKVLNFDNPECQAEYTIYGHDKQPKTYTVTLKLAGDTGVQGPDVYDISKGNVTIFGHYVEYGGTKFKPNPTYGYVITGTTTENDLTIDGYTADSDQTVEIPKIVMRDLNITSAKSISPFTVSVGAEIQVEGNCSIKSLTATGANLSNTYSLTDGVNVKITGNGKLDIIGAESEKGATVGLNTSLEITGVATTIKGGMAQSALTGAGKFITDSQTIMHLVNGTDSGIQPKDSEGNPLYQVTAKICGTEKTASMCTYNDKTYNVGDDLTLYFMMPNGSHDMRVIYNNEEYIDSFEIADNEATADLYTVRVTSIDYDNTTLDHNGGDVVFTLTGTRLDSKEIKIKAVANRDDIEPIEEIVQKNNDKYTATITLPINTSYEIPVTYTFYYILDGQENELPKKLVVLNDKTACEITAFEMPNQVGDTLINSTQGTDGINHTITIYMPYDHEFINDKYYTPSNIEFIGKNVAPNRNVPTKFTYYVSQNYMSAIYTVFALDGVTKKDYQVMLKKRPTPYITSLSFSPMTNPDGGTLTVTASGQSTNSIQTAEKPENRKVYIYSDDGIAPVEAQLQTVGGIDKYVAQVPIPKNTSDTEEAKYVLKARIGNTEQTGINSEFATVKVPRQKRKETGIERFELENQVGESVIQENSINVTMPYDADLSQMIPTVYLKDLYASYEPNGYCNFSNDIKFTVTAEDGITKKEYTVHTQKQETPVATSINFTNPAYSSAGRITVKINGTNLDNAENAISVPATIRVKGTLTSGETANSDISTVTAVKNDDGDYVATITVPRNNNSTERTYTLSVIIGNTEQTLTGSTTLTVPAQEPNSNELTDIILVDGQSELTFSGNNVYLYVPYNTDLRSIEPEVFHSGKSYEPQGPQNFNSPVVYAIIAENGTRNEYNIIAERSGTVGITNCTITQPESYSNSTATVDLEGQFIPYITENVAKDKIKLTAIPRGGGNNVEGTVLYDKNVYGGKATVTLNLPKNETSEDKIYDIEVKINEIPQNIGTKIVTVPKKKSRKITSFLVNNQSGDTQIDNDNNTIFFKMPYYTDLTSLKPQIKIDGDSITVGDVTTNANESGQVSTAAQNFEGQAVTYTVSAKDDEDRVYKATVQRDGKPAISSVEVQNRPDSFKGSTVTVDVQGIFFYGMKVKAVCNDNTEVPEENIKVTMNEWHHATAEITLPENLDTTADKVYTLKFYLDGFEEEIEYNTITQITVPRRKTRAITNFRVKDQVGSATIGESEITVTVAYETDIRHIKPLTVQIDGDNYSPSGDEWDFDNDTKSLLFKVSAKDDVDREYTVHIKRDGTPTIANITYISPSNFKGSTVTVNIRGTFFESVNVSAVPEEGGTEIVGSVYFNHDEPGSAVASLNIPTNYDTENPKVYKLKFVMDGFLTTYIGGTEITVPRRTTREISKFELPDDIQEGETIIQGTNIYIAVPYNIDISSIVPKSIVYDADTISPSADQALDFSNAENPVEYTLSSAGDENKTYKVIITRPGEDPYLKSFVFEKQKKDTVYEGDNVTITMPSNTNLKEIEPIIEYQGTDYSPKGPQDFSKSKDTPIVYTIVNQYGVEHKYNVTVTKDKKGSSTNSNATPTPTVEPTIEPTTEPTVNPSESPSPSPLNKPYINGNVENGVQIFRPNDTITRAEVAKILSVISSDFDENTVYPDVSDDIKDDAWYRNYINYAVSKGYISGYDDGTYRVENMITRAEFASIIARYMNLPLLDIEDKFNDIASFDWCRLQINTLSESGIISGYDDGSFMPNNNITRSEVVSMINRVLGRTMTEEIASKAECPFADVDSTHWAYNDIILASCEF